MNKWFKFLIGTIFIAVLNVGFFLLVDSCDRETTFWISWVFIHIAFLVALIINVFVVEHKKLIYGYTDMAISIAYFVVELVVGILFIMALPSHNIAAFLIQLILLGLFSMVYIGFLGMNRNIESAQQESKRNLMEFRSLVETMKTVKDAVEYSAPYRKTVEHAYDAMAGSPVHSEAGAAEIENAILTTAGQLKSAVFEKNEEKVTRLCGKIEELVADRNRYLRAHQ
ncbi:MAG: hypothetical protein ACI4HQ_01800 [Acetatifactor sp.]